IPAVGLVWPLAVCAGEVPADAIGAGATLLSHHLVVHDVEGIGSGVYRWTAHGPELHRSGTLRREATAACLEQPLGGESAYTVFHLADLARILDGGGERAYRVVQFAAGVASERLQLAAHTLGLGGTGLTFYDEEVRRFVDTTLDPMLVTAVGTPAYDPVPGERPADSPAARLDALTGRRGAVEKE
ncbi:MAG: nitroreductase family protein, partial [Nitriliruptorales bacterium]|nr:nitroreductase family protein [Nitriliruptorales bacterium]